MKDVGEVNARTLIVASAATPSIINTSHSQTPTRPQPPPQHHYTLRKYCTIIASTHHPTNMAMDTDAIPNLLGDARDEAPEELQEYFIAFEDYWERKLWHELTDKLIEFFDHPDSAKQRIPFFENFIKTFANKINQLKLVTLGLNAATQYTGMTCLLQMQVYC
jgi:hypothetical protein